MIGHSYFPCIKVCSLLSLTFLVSLNKSKAWIFLQNQGRHTRVRTEDSRNPPGGTRRHPDHGRRPFRRRPEVLLGDRFLRRGDGRLGRREPRNVVPGVAVRRLGRDHPVQPSWAHLPELSPVHLSRQQGHARHQHCSHC